MKRILAIVVIVSMSGCSHFPQMVLQLTNDVGQVYNVDARWWAVTKELGKAGMTIGAFVVLF